jgi:hypothetical protein
MRSRLAVGHGRLSNEPLAGAGIEYPLEVIVWVIPRFGTALPVNHRMDLSTPHDRR